MRKIYLMTVAIFAILSVLCSCSGKGSQDTSSVEVTDFPATAFEATVKKCPQNVVSLVPEVTDIITALGSDAQLVGVSDNCVTQREVKRLGTAFSPDIAGIKSIKADLVFVSDITPQSDISTLKNAGIAVAEVKSADKYSDLLRIYSDIATLMSGNITGKRNATNTFSRIDSGIKKFSNSSSTDIKAAVFVTESVIMSGKGVATELANFAGIALTDGDKATIVICPVGTKDAFAQKFPEKRIEEFDMSLFDRRGADMLDCVKELNAVIS